MSRPTEWIYTCRTACSICASNSEERTGQKGLMEELPFQFCYRALDKGLDHLGNALFHFGANTIFAYQTGQQVEFLRALATHFHSLHDSDQRRRASFLENRGISQIILALGLRGRPLD